MEFPRVFVFGLAISKGFKQFCGMGYSRLNPNKGVGGGGWGYTFLKKPLEFFIFLLYPGNSRQKKAQPRDIPQNCLKSLGNANAKNKRPLEIPHLFSLVTLWNSTFLMNPWKFHILFLWYLCKFHILSPSCFDFFWNSPKSRGWALFCLEFPGVK